MRGLARRSFQAVLRCPREDTISCLFAWDGVVPCMQACMGANPQRCCIFKDLEADGNQ